MRKWVVLALGAVLALAGLMSIWQGSDIIQIERGWTAVIAGAVTLAGGVVTIAIYVLISEVEDLRESLSAPARPSVEAAPRPVAASSEPIDEAPAAVPPIEAATAAAAAAPAMSAMPDPFHAEPAPAVIHPAPEPEPPTPLAQTQEPEPQPAFERPDSPVRRGFGALSAGKAAAGAAAGIGALGAVRAFRFRRPTETETENQISVPTPPEPESHGDASLRAIEAAIFAQVTPERPALEAAASERSEPAHDPVPHVDFDAEPPHPVEDHAERVEGPEPVDTVAEEEPEHVDSAEPEGVRELEAYQAGAAPQPPRTDLDWLEKALAGEEEPDPALDWLRQRVHPEAPEHAPAHEPEQAQEPHADPAEQAFEFHPDHEAHGDEAHEQTPAHEEAVHVGSEHHEPAPALPDATVLGRYSTGGTHYTLYSDGSIEADTQQGTFRFESMEALKTYFKSQNATG